MEKWDAGLSQPPAGTTNASEYNQNIVEFESRRQLRDAISELINLTISSPLTTSDLQLRLNRYKATFGKRFMAHLIRALLHSEQDERDAIVWLLTRFNDRETIAPLQQIIQNERLSRSVRLSASLALAGMGATEEMQNMPHRFWLYAIS
ncbi:MAG: hypothetical protein JO215_01120 [Ktedonobacteraceae bacterium]|nr:hypothetical protein [Ktedonobacteraceae bacterium]